MVGAPGRFDPEPAKVIYLRMTSDGTRNGTFTFNLPLEDWSGDFWRVGFDGASHVYISGPVRDGEGRNAVAVMRLNASTRAVDDSFGHNGLAVASPFRAGVITGFAVDRTTREPWAAGSPF